MRSDLFAAYQCIYRRMVLQGLTSHSTHCRSFRRRFYRSDDPTNSVTALKDDNLPCLGPIPQAYLVALICFKSLFGPPRVVFGGLYRCAKLRWNPCSNFDNMQVLIFCELGLKMHYAKFHYFFNEVLFSFYGT